MRSAPAKSSPWVFACTAAGLFAVLWWSHRAQHDLALGERHSLWLQTLPKIEPQPANGPYAGHFTAVEKPAAKPFGNVDESAGNASSFAIQIELSQLVAEHHLSLTPEQLKAFAAVTSAAQAARHRYEATIAQVLPKHSNRLEMVVPMYSEVGDDLRTVYYQALRTQLGEGVANQIQQSLGADLETMFGDFGSSEQGLEVAVANTSTGPEYTVNSTAVFWAAPTPTPTPAGVANSLFAVHRETHLLPIEDPSGTTWGDFVRLFASQS